MDTLLNRIIRTSPDHIFTLARDFALRYKDETGALDRLEVIDLPKDNPARFKFNLRRYIEFGTIGYVEVLQINDLEARVRVVQYDMLPSFVQERREIHDAGLAFLKAFVEYLLNTFGSGLSIHPGTETNFNQGISAQRLLSPTPKAQSSKQPKRDVLERVANAFLLLEQKLVFRRIDAATRARTSVMAMRKYEHHPDVTAKMDYFKSHPDELNKFRSRTASRPRRGKKIQSDTS